MSELQKLIEEFLASEPSPCWLTPGSEIREWAEAREAAGATPGSHGLGDLTKTHCEPKPGTICPACGLEWPL